MLFFIFAFFFTKAKILFRFILVSETDTNVDILALLQSKIAEGKLWKTLGYLYLLLQSPQPHFPQGPVGGDSSIFRYLKKGLEN